MKKIKSISTKLGLLFSGIFVVLLLILGIILYGIFINIFGDYVKQDLLVRGNNHAKVLEGQFNESTIDHVIRMEKGATTKVLITDPNQSVIGSSVPLDEDMKNHLLPKGKVLKKGLLVETDWKHHDYIISVSPIGKNEGFVYMYYPAYILREIVVVLNLLILIASLGVVLLAFGFVGILSKRLTMPLLMMKDATNKMSLGRYQQKIPMKGNDEIAQLGKSIQSLGEQLQYFEDSRNDFLAGVSHELRTPLTYIKGYSDILMKGMYKSSQEQKQYLQIINNEAKRLSVLVNDLFEMSKLQANEFLLEREYSNINQIIDKVITNLQPEMLKKGIKITSNLQEIPLIIIDPKRVEQVLYNLIENALKYTQEGEISITSYIEKGFVKIKVKDTGIGIPKSDLTKIFDRFYRVEQSRARKTGGTGLGLYVVKQIIEAHEGEIMVESIENAGSAFTISIKI
ncbi:cell wall metabolism sensor histidine kinase WalK [Neobacillus mesonae]|uniref:sensor histidine kinase n=1 Tax=Neobacillus mesonae TaxID=1193713 RepID=UPI00203E389C|nr:HAMP domain-containing sensor histidine kinase [Neobacillus mesonae]MCM3571258.1 HAMP domain-containing histidine kinase [Neobacillus mesonae]